MRPEADGGRSPELLDGPESRTSQHSVSTSRSRGSWPPIAGLGALILIGFVGLASLGSDETVDPDRAEQSLNDGDNSRRISPLPPPGIPPTTMPTQLDPAGFSRPTGYDLVMGGGSPLLRLGLDSGTIERYEERATPLAVTGEYLLIESDGWMTVPLDDLGAEPFDLAPPGREVYPGISATTGHLWLLPSSGSSALAQRVDPGSGAVLEEREISSESSGHIPGPYSSVSGSPDYMSPLTGGVYRFGDDGYKRVLDGRILVRGVRLALIETCDDRLRCSEAWFDLDTELRVDHPTPPDADGYRGILGSDRWLVQAHGPNWEYELIEIGTGRIVDQMSGRREPLSISPDGRLAAVNDGDSLVVVDLDTGERVEFPRALLNGFDWPPPLFVPSASGVKPVSIEQNG